jgi:hypothetical protein
MNSLKILALFVFSFMVLSAFSASACDAVKLEKFGLSIDFKFDKKQAGYTATLKEDKFFGKSWPLTSPEEKLSKCGLGLGGFGLERITIQDNFLIFKTESLFGTDLYSFELNSKTKRRLSQKQEGSPTKYFVTDWDWFNNDNIVIEMLNSKTQLTSIYLVGLSEERIRPIGNEGQFYGLYNTVLNKSLQQMVLFEKNGGLVLFKDNKIFKIDPAVFAGPRTISFVGKDSLIYIKNEQNQFSLWSANHSDSEGSSQKLLSDFNPWPACDYMSSSFDGMICIINSSRYPITVPCEDSFIFRRISKQGESIWKFDLKNRSESQLTPHREVYTSVEELSRYCSR